MQQTLENPQSIMHRADMVQAYSQAGYPVIACVGHGTTEEIKRPRQDDWQNTPRLNPLHKVDIYAFALKHRTYGVVLQDDDFLFDCDEGRYTDDSSKPASLWQRLQIASDWWKQTFVVKTGNGFHIYSKKPPDFDVKSVVPKYKAIEIKTKGRFVCGAGSWHGSGVFYTAFKGVVSNIIQAPKQLLDYCAQTSTRKESSISGASIEADDVGAVRQFTAYLKNLPTPTQHTYQTACKAWDFGVNEQMAYRLMLKHFLPRRYKPLSESALQEKVAHAYRYAKNDFGALHISNDFLDLELAEISDPQQNDRAIRPIEPADQLFDTNKRQPDRKSAPQLDYQQNGRLYGNMNNASIFLNEPQYPFANLVRLNVFSGEIELTRRPPWLKKDEATPLYWTNGMAVMLRTYLSMAHKLDVTGSTLHDALYAAAAMKRYHPIKEYLDSVAGQWDGTKRIDTWLIDYCNAYDTKYIRAVGKNIFLSACARIYQPGCEVHSMAVIEGEEGLGKTEVCKILGGQFFGDPHLNPDDKDTIGCMQGIWISECAEMTVSRFTDPEALKAFLTRNTDRIRPAYAHITERFPRQCIFIGTTNLDQYLKDTGGNRRYWPISTKNVGFRLEDLRRDRDQLFAEAMVRYGTGEKWHLDTPELIAAAKIEQYKRQEVDPWKDKISTWIENGCGDPIYGPPPSLRADEVAQALGIPTSKQNSQTYRRISSCMKQLDWKAKRKMVNGHQVNLWEKY